MEREIIKLSNNQWRDLVWETYLKIDGQNIEIQEIDDIYDGSSRHTEEHHKIIKRRSDSKFFSIDYETSIKDSMGWNECNYGEGELREVFPETKTITIYK